MTHVQFSLRFRGRVAPEQSIKAEGLLSTVKGYIPSMKTLSSYAQSLGGGDAAAAAAARHRATAAAASAAADPSHIVSSRVQKIFLGRFCEYFVTICYELGLQVYHVSASSVVEVLSVRGIRAKDAMIAPFRDPALETRRSLAEYALPYLLIVPRKSPFDDVQSATRFVAAETVEGEAPLGENDVIVYSLRELAPVRVLRHQSHVLRLCVSEGAIAVLTANRELSTYDAVTLRPLFKNALGSIVSNEGAAAVGSAWLAYPDDMEPATVSSVVSERDAFKWDVQAARDVASSVAATAAQHVSAGLSQIGEFGKRQLVQFLYGADSVPAPPPPPPPKTTNGRKGIVAVRNVWTNDLVAHFHSDHETIAWMSFDPTGSLLCVAATGCREVLLYRLLGTRAKLLYVLKRGNTDAAIQSIVFSGDSRWLAALSSHGTVHIYGINQWGGPVAMKDLTGPARGAEFVDMQSPALQLYPQCRIRLSLGEASQSSISFVSDLFGYRQALMSVDAEGVCSVHEIVAFEQPSTSSADHQPALAVEAQLKRRWSLLRPEHWGDHSEAVVVPLADEFFGTPPPSALRAAGGLDIQRSATSNSNSSASAAVAAAAATAGSASSAADVPDDVGLPLIEDLQLAPAAGKDSGSDDAEAADDAAASAGDADGSSSSSNGGGGGARPRAPSSGSESGKKARKGKQKGKGDSKPAAAAASAPSRPPAAPASGAKAAAAPAPAETEPSQPRAAAVRHFPPPPPPTSAAAAGGAPSSSQAADRQWQELAQEACFDSFALSALPLWSRPQFSIRNVSLEQSIHLSAPPVPHAAGSDDDVVVSSQITQPGRLEVVQSSVKDVMSKAMGTPMNK